MDMTSIGAPRIFAMFPGQGSQKVGMGKELSEKMSLARELFDIADTRLGLSLSKLCFEGPEQDLVLTKHAQPAILVVSVATYLLAAERFNTVIAAGHSLGEYSALVAAGALDLGDAVELVHKRGIYMQEAVPTGVGKMVAVLGKEVGEIEEAIGKVKGGVAEIANINAPGQIVVSGTKEGVDEFVSLLGGAKVVELAVSAPFHSSLMKQAEEKLAKDLRGVKIEKPRFPVISNITALPVTDPEEIRNNLIRQVCGRVRWTETVEYVAAEVEISGAVEFGAGATLTGLVKRTTTKFKGHSCDSVEKVESIVATLNK